ncbi:MAG TPA: class I SAM-dependent methyltransferase [Acidimicrobiia bacterium]|nr:class I SAM-dependent methyltransferase [Acidimicrobiia bacterium]
MTETVHLARPEPVRHPHPVRAWANAKFFESLDWYLHRRLGARKKALLADLPPLVVELGSGSGASMRYLAPGSRLLAVEPNPHAHAALRRKAARYGIDLEICGVGAESTGLATASVDAVICTLVLCTVEDQVAVLTEVRRILRPGGRFVFIEHVGSGPGPIRAVQRLLRRPWRYVFDGCCLDRDTAATIAAAGFADARIDQYRLGGLFVPVWPQISGVAVA